MTTDTLSSHGAAATFARRVLGAILLDGHAFQDVEQHPRSLLQAAAVVLLAGLARGLAALPAEGAVGLVGSPLVGVFVWLAAGAMIWAVGVRRLHYSSDYPELLRTIGFAAAPLLWLVFGVLPLGGAVAWISWIAHAWATLALVVAVREALDVPFERALVVCAIALGVTLLILFVGSFLVVAALG